MQYIIHLDSWINVIADNEETAKIIVQNELDEFKKQGMGDIKSEILATATIDDDTIQEEPEEDL